MSEQEKTAGKEILAKLMEFGLSKTAANESITELGLENVEDLAMLTEADLSNMGIKLVQARKIINSFKIPETTPNNIANQANFGAASFASLENILPTAPDDESWLKSLKSGGVLKVDQSSIVSAVRAALAYRVGLFEVPNKLIKEMEKFADESDNPVDAVFFTISRQITQRSYADIFSSIEGLNGNFVTEGRKKQLFSRMDQYFFPAIGEFYGALKSWYENYQLQSSTNAPAIIASLIRPNTGFQPGIIQAPDTGTLRDHADYVNDAINRTFAGMGTVISAAMAYDAMQIRDTLQNPKLPALIGAPNRDQMLKQIGVSVNATYPRLEQNLIRFILGVLQASDQPAGDEELQYYSALAVLGAQINFDQIGIGNNRITGISGKQL